MTIKGGAYPQTIMDTVRIIISQGQTIDQAIAKVESILHGKLPEKIKDLIHQECK